MLISLVIPFNVTYAQNSYIHKESIGKSTTPSVIKKEAFAFYPISSWVGKRFIFLPSPKSLQKSGYQSFKGGDGEYGHPSYNKYVGRIAKVVSVNKEQSLYNVQFVMEDDGHRLTATAYSENIWDIALIADIDNARSKWLDKTLWYAGNKLVTYNEDTEKFGSVNVKKYLPVKVTDIVLGWFEHQPIRFILQTSSGKEGFRDINLSGTNTSNRLRDNVRFKDYFLTKDPRKTYKWPDKVWSSIERESVFIGMTAKQARMGWGKPKTINKTTSNNTISEQWVYSSGSYLYFENGVLTTIQN